MPRVFSILEYPILDSKALRKTTDVDTNTFDFKEDFELENEQIIGAFIYS